ncbi:hypothetical protein B0H10DRAFT_2185729 [Mycena sp. CBHHK59/15]|nr:hypothetical protein B0H10DRAFT_2185729 [Mycena sp. CBHHK59/15]
MEMPAPSSKAKTKRNVPDAPRLSTRSQNQATRPAVLAGLAPGNRCTAVDMEEARATEAAQQADAVRKQADAIACVAAIEDEQRARDQTSAETANHPVDPPARAPESPSPIWSLIKTSSFHLSPAMKSRRSSPGDALASQLSRAATRNSTEDASGTPTGSGQDARKRKVSENRRVTSLNSNGKRPGTKKAKLVKKGGLATSNPAKMAKGVASSASGRSSIATALNDELDAPMSQYSGPAVDDDENERLEHPAPAGKGKKKGLPTDPGLKLVSAPPRHPTKKELRGNASKWTLEHLPHATAALFTSDVVPLARQLLGSLEPWAKLSVAQIQDIVNLVFPPKEGEHGPVHVVTEEGPWWGLLQYRSHDWRNGFHTQADKGMRLLHTAEQSDDDSDEDQEDPEQDPAAPSDSNEDPPASKKPRSFKFDTPAGIADFVEWALQKHENGTMVFQWQQWGDGKVKKVRPMSPVYTLLTPVLGLLPFLSRCVRICVSSIHPRVDTHYIRALDRTSLWCAAYRGTGSRVQSSALARGHVHCTTHPPPGEFSAENWGDIKTHASKTKNTITRRATKFMSAVQKWDDERWEELRAAVAEWVDKKKVRASSSRGTSEVEDMEDTEDEEPEVIVLSD